MDEDRDNGPSRQRPGDDEGPTAWGKAGQALLIPSLMAAGPLAGLLIGWTLRRWTGWGNWIVVVFVLLGVVAGIRETVKIIRKL
jgi:F0F1-type ATP synthase assembly protein I